MKNRITLIQGHPDAASFCAALAAAYQAGAEAAGATVRVLALRELDFQLNLA